MNNLKENHVKIIESKIEDLIDRELKFANTQFPQFASEHEGYAVLLEEVEELEEETEKLKTHLEHMWFDIKNNDYSFLAYSIKCIEVIAINAIQETIQVAAMCKKFEKLYESEDKSC